MRISELSEATGMPIATLKFYLREGVLHAGTPQAKTQSSYDESHIQRVKLVRALTEVGGLSIAATRKVFDAMDDPDTDRLSLLATAQESLAPTAIVPRDSHPLAQELLDRVHWHYDPNDRMMHLLERQLEALRDTGVTVTEQQLDGLAGMAKEIAKVDLSNLNDDSAEAVLNVIVGTALVDRLIVTLRRLAQTHVAMTHSTYVPKHNAQTVDF